MRALALLLACIAPARAAFYGSGELPSAPAGFPQAWAAGQRISMQEPGFSCSAAVVSPDGYVLTNLHCILPCLEEAGLKPAAARKEPHYSYTLTGEQAPVGKSCGLGLNKYRIWELGTEPGPGDPVWSVGFPSWSERPDGRRSNGADKMASAGKVRGSIREDPVLGEILKSPAQWDRESEFFDQKRLLLTDLDAMPNSSGSMMLDSSGELAAVLFNSTKVSTERYTGGTVTGVTAAAILDEVRRGLGAEKAGRIFNCPKGGNYLLQSIAL